MAVEFGARLSLKDNMYATLQKNLKIQKEFSEQVRNTDASVKELGKKKVSPTVRLRDNVTGHLMGVKREIRAMSNVKALTKAEVDDRATRKIEDIKRGIKNLGKMVASPFIKLKETVLAKGEKIKQKLKEIATTYTPIVKIRDLASAGLAKIKNTLNWLRVAVITPVIMVKDLATSVINKVRVALRVVGKTVAKPFLYLKDKASPILSKVGDALKKVGKTVAKATVLIKDVATKVISGVWSGLKKIGSTTARATVAIKDKATAGLEKIGKLVGGLAKGATITLGVAGAGLTALVGGAIGQGAGLEQSIGGVETLFKGDAGIVKANADKAFKSAGLSANAYMEQVTSFSASLLQSLGGDTAKSATVADMAIVDMADNANKMGTSMDMIQNAYQGFAKQNYTMLDNLKLGYGGTEEEMKRLLADAQKLTGVSYNIDNLADVYNAIHVIQEDIGITGTTAKEASATFSGSFASMKSAVQNLLGNLAIGGDVESSMEQVVDTASTFLFDNAIPMIGRVIQALPKALSTGIAKAMPKIKEAGGGIAKGIKDGLMSMLPESVRGSVGSAFDGIGSVITEVKSFLGSLAPVATQLFGDLSTRVSMVIEVVKNVFPTIVSTFQTVLANISPIITTFQGIFTSAMPVVQGIIEGVCQFISGIMPTVSDIFSFVGGVIQSILGIIGNHMGEFKECVAVVVEAVTNIWATLKPAISSAVEFLLPIIDKLLTVFTKVFKGIVKAVSTAIEWVVGAISSAVEAISGFIEKISGAIETAKEWVGSGVDKVKSWFGFAYGKDRVPYDNYPAILHQGEKVLTRNQADQYERTVSTRGVQLTPEAKPLPRDTGSGNATGAPTGSTQAKQENTVKNTSFNIEKLADTVVIEKEADVDKVVEDMITKFRKIIPNMS